MSFNSCTHHTAKHRQDAPPEVADPTGEGGTVGDPALRVASSEQAPQQVQESVHVRNQSK